MTDDPDSSSRPDSPDIAIPVTVLSPAWHETLPGAARLARRAARAALAGAGEAVATGREAELSLVLADEATLRRLNREYRGRDAPTNVLAFAAPAEGYGPVLLGDVVIAREVVQREAAEQGKPLADHLCHLVVHGVLHLLGYDHGTPAQAGAMERLERAVLAGLGVADPYAERAAS